MLAVSLLGCAEPQWPYDEIANAVQDVAAARALAQRDNKLLMLIFGANWCEDCRVLDGAMQDGEILELLEERFIQVKIDVGNWDKHLDLVHEWGDPIQGGIPAMVVASAAGEVMYSTAAGELATARRMKKDDFYLFFAHLAELRASTAFSNPTE